MRKAPIRPVLFCLRCNHTWTPRSDQVPVRCAGCGSPYWMKPRVRGVRTAKA